MALRRQIHCKLRKHQQLAQNHIKHNGNRKTQCEFFFYFFCVLCCFATFLFAGVFLSSCSTSQGHCRLADFLIDFIVVNI